MAYGRGRALGLFLGLWTLLSLSGLVPHQFLPAPLDVASRASSHLLTTPFAGATLPQHLARASRYLLRHGARGR